MNPEAAGTQNGYWMPTIVVDQSIKFDREALLKVFKANDIDGRVFFWPLSMLPMFASKPTNLVSYNLFARGVNLPSFHEVEYSQLATVSQTIIDFFDGQ
jgi:perosamine synthetase